MTFCLGLTGSIGMGKSTTAQMFADAGIPVWDADAVVHALYDGGAAAEQIAKVFPNAVTDGAVSRDALKQIIASDKTALKTIEDIVHPLVAADRQAFIDDHQADILLFDIPLLFETNADAWLDAIVVVTAPAAVQRQRVMDRPGMTEEQFQMILSRQTLDAEKRDRADYIIETLTLDDARAGVEDVIRQIRGQQDA